MTFLSGPVSPGDLISDFDRFQTSTKFYGPQIGGRLDWRSGSLVAGVTSKLGLGVNQQTADVIGTSGLVTAGGATTAPGGVLALPTNMGHHFRNQFSVVYDLGLNVGYEIVPGVSARIGYSFLYWSNVARPGKQIDRAVNPGQIPTDQDFGTPGPARPAFAFQNSDFWAQGLNFGMELRY